MKDEEVESKLKHILLGISRNKMDEEHVIEIIEHSSFDFETHWNNQTFPNAYNLTITVNPEIFTKRFSGIDIYAKLIKNRINDSSNLFIDKIKILPDYNKLQIVNSKVFSVITEWDEINQLQNKLLENLRLSSQPIDFQSIGLLSRTLMDKIARLVFNPQIHKPKNENISVANGKFKNQLHSYIDITLSGENNREFRKLANSSIDFVEDSIDIMNTVTHKLNTERHLAEVCVISTISAISIINLIRQLDK